MIFKFFLSLLLHFLILFDAACGKLFERWCAFFLNTICNVLLKKYSKIFYNFFAWNYETSDTLKNVNNICFLLI